MACSGLLPEESFEEVRYGGPDCPLASYNWFTSGEEPESSRSSVKDTAQGTRMKRLKRGYSSEADQLLNWLVCAICLEDALLLMLFPIRSKEYLKLLRRAI